MASSAGAGTAGSSHPDDEALLKKLHQQNPWWDAGIVPPASVRKFKRRDYSGMAGRLDDPLAQSVLGARQVGKTTMLYQLMADLISSGCDARRVLFIALDARGLIPSADSLLRMLELYADNVVGESLYRLTKRVYAVLDEVQIVRDWERVVKTVVDQGHPVKFIVSGSSSADIFRGSSESLIGRIWHQTISPMSFAEYASFKNPELAKALREAGSDMQRGLDESVRAGCAGPLGERARRACLGLAGAHDRLAARLAEYMLYGGYPGVAARSGGLEKAELLKSSLDLTLYRDVAEAGNVRNRLVIDRMFHFIAWRSPQMINKNKLARNLGVNKGTVDSYKELLRQTFLVSYADFYTPNPAVRFRKEKKAYVNDVGMRNTAADEVLLDSVSALDNPAEVGRMAETVAGDHTRRLWMSLAPTSAAPMPHYWRNGSRAEVDMVITHRHRPIPIEVKYRRHVAASDLGGLSRFSDKFDPPLSIAVSRDDLRLVGDRTAVIPMWLYLLMC